MQASTVQQGTLSYIPLSLIVPGRNPRVYFDPTEMEELTASVLAKGVIQSVALRAIEGGKYEILAGERRCRAALAAFGEDYEMPSTIMEVADDEVESISLTENIQKAAMSASEESDSAARILTKNKGDLDETAKELGWPLNKLSRRLALQNLSPKAKEALTTRVITLGHAELLASVPIIKQDGALAQIIEHELTVTFVKNNLLKKTLSLNSAIFCQDQCAACPYNTSRQKSLFTESLGVDGNCTNSDCYSEKELAHVEQLRLELAEEFPNARTVAIGDTSFALLTEQVVGAEQFMVCKGCGDYGASVSTVPGQIGVVNKSVCFALECRKEKISDLAQAKKAIEVSQKLQEKATKTQAGAGGAKEVKGAKAVKKAGEKPQAKVVHSISTRVKEFRRSVWNMAAKRELAASPDRARAFIIDLAINNLLGQVRGMEMKDIYKKLTGKDYKEANGSIFAAVFGLAEEIQVKLLTAMAVTTIESLAEEKVEQALDLLEVDLAKHFTINRDYLDLLTKSELESLCAELEIDGNIAEYGKVKVGKREDFIKAILGCGVSFIGRVPKMLHP